MDISIGDRRLHAQRIFCIGRNYAAHAEELGNDIPDEPVVFMKPPSALVASGEAVLFPGHGDELHHEAELVIVIGRTGRVTKPEQAARFIAGLGLGLDLTMRDVQRDLKAKGLPWERAKAFPQSAPLGPLRPYDDSVDLGALTFTCRVNDEIRQEGDTSLMLFPVAELLVRLSAIWTLRLGDLIFTGTPKGVGELETGDVVSLEGPGFETARWPIV